ncbi:hypothetical protein V5O48_004285 [Marasmius crinis-equi]|uniref:TM7S3/TM198-like domain-containing protein n=1 Tax=Marasmius crinis-equi TaxID=585013 RepID=A0ABR3FQF6_9AGAR
MVTICLSRLQCYLTFVLFHCIISTHALYLSPLPPSIPHRLLPRDAIVTTGSDGSIVIVDSRTNQAIPQGLATDGSGSNFSPPALVWLIYCCTLGLPLALAGIRGWRFTTGIGISVCFAVSAWAALINSVDENGISDILLTISVLAFSFLGFILGVFHFAYLGGVVGMTLAGGVAFGVRIVIIQPNLLVSADNLFAVNWVIPTVCAVVAGLVLVRWQRVGLLFGCASVGTFLVFLGVDLIINKQSGMSRGLRFLFDRNSNHLADLLSTGYHPALSTRILVAISLGLTPILAYAQHRFFPAPFNRKVEPSDELLSLNYPTNMRTAFSGFFGDTKLNTPSRFSL